MYMRQTCYLEIQLHFLYGPYGIICWKSYFTLPVDMFFVDSPGIEVIEYNIKYHLKGWIMHCKMAISAIFKIPYFL